MRDLEEVEARQSLGAEARVDVLLDVAGQQEATLPDRTKQHDRHVVDARTGVGRLGRHLAADRPQDAQLDLVDRQPIAGGQRKVRRRVRSSESIEPGGVPWPRSAHARLEHPRDVVPGEQQGESGDVVLVRVGQDHRVESAIPGRYPSVELDEQPIGIRSAVHE